MLGPSCQAFGVRMEKTQQRRLAMKRTQEVKRSESGERNCNLYLAFELGNTKWKLAFSDGEKVRFISIVARGLKQLREEVEKAKKRFRLVEGLGSLGPAV